MSKQLIPYEWILTALIVIVFIGVMLSRTGPNAPQDPTTVPTPTVTVEATPRSTP